jgi:hypothetical protein
MQFDAYCVQYRDGNKKVPKKLSQIDSYIVILKFISQGGDEISSCGFQHDMYPPSG